MGLKNRLFRYFFPEIVAKCAISRMSPSSGVVLMYHEVLPDDFKLPAWTVVRESDFRWQMIFLKTHFDVVSMDHALDRITGKTDSHRPFAVVTFDDGYKGNIDVVLPLMESMGLPFTVFIATQAVVDQKQYWYDRIINLLDVPRDIHVCLTLNGQNERYKISHLASEQCRWQQVQGILSRLKLMAPPDRDKNVESILEPYADVGASLQMLTPEESRRLAASACVTVGSHTHGHELLDQLTPQEVQGSLRTAHLEITRMTGLPPRHFAYPNGNLNSCVKEQVHLAGYETAVTTTPGIWSAQNCLLEIPRISVGRFETRGSFRSRVSGYL
ncbi:polysaccharide deacetylase family protein [Oryzomonas japonica]|uniref:Polysaccharide deacetylase family protein n=1 Tax=Oryzomonas japonica TaxID=2603858 RepID=A0A7J4ZSS6_9BACT|nr:polysaccharide deacetylase family protein [Oryzomonas japonica]KAB0666488.1 polysaccharide deacetylase family protein [Oryzomonas japonica]